MKTTSNMSSYSGYAGSAYNSPAGGSVSSPGGQTIQPGSITYTTTTDANGVVTYHPFRYVFLLCFIEIDSTDHYIFIEPSQQGILLSSRLHMI